MSQVEDLPERSKTTRRVEGPAACLKPPPFHNDSFPLASILAHLVSQATDALDSDREAARAALKQASAFLQAEHARPDLFAHETSPLATWQMRRIQEHIDSHIDSHLELAELAQMVNLSKSYFCRAFKTSFGQSLSSHIMARRIACAQRHMLTKNEKLCQVALDCGFSDQAHLSRAFRQHTGVTPKEWRRRWQVGQPTL